MTDKIEIPEPHKDGDTVEFGKTYQVYHEDGALYEYTIGYSVIHAWPSEELDDLKQKHLDEITKIEEKQAKIEELKPTEIAAK